MWPRNASQAPEPPVAPCWTPIPETSEKMPFVQMVTYCMRFVSGSGISGWKKKLQQLSGVRYCEHIGFLWLPRFLYFGLQSLSLFFRSPMTYPGEDVSGGITL